MNVAEIDLSTHEGLHKAGARIARKEGTSACDALYELAISKGAEPALASGYAHTIHNAIITMEEVASAAISPERTPEDKLRLAVQALMEVIPLRPKVNADDLTELMEALHSMVSLQAAEEAQVDKVGYEAEEWDVGGMFRRIEEARMRRAAIFPTEGAAMDIIKVATMRLRDLGWTGIEYSPKDGSSFQSYELGSHDSSTTMYLGEWPAGGWFCCDGGDLYPAYPPLFKPRPS